jgi:hypothetical protein
MSGPCCFSGSLSEGTPAGTVELYGGVQTYVAPFTGTPDVAIVMIPDVFGFEVRSLCRGLSPFTLFLLLFLAAYLYH